MNNRLFLGSETRDIDAGDGVSIHVRCLSQYGAAHGLCEDCRADASIDLVHDRETLKAGQKVTAPLLILCGEQGGRAPVF